MRRQHFEWTFLVLALVLTIYGGGSLIYNHTHGKDMSILGLVFFIIGLILLVTYIVLFLVSYFQRKKTPEVKEEPADVKEEKSEEPTQESEEKAEITKEESSKPKTNYNPRDEVTYVSSRTVSKSRYDTTTVYVRQVGYGPVLRVTGSEILDMRTNTYYTIDGNIVKENGSGPVFEISGNRIRSAFGGYLYEISGSNINKTYGGFYASISGSYIQVYDLSEKYEISDSLSLKQQLAVIALLFGSY